MFFFFNTLESDHRYRVAPEEWTSYNEIYCCREEGETCQDMKARGHGALR